MHTLKAISPIDGRYHKQTQALQEIFSEYALMQMRCKVEIYWVKMLGAHPVILQRLSLSKIADRALHELDELITNFSISDAERIKQIEVTTKHDLKSIEYFLREKFAQNENLSKYSELIHFGCTSDDINNLAYALMLQMGISDCLLPTLSNLRDHLRDLARKYAATPMLGRTHGQPATPTTLGKEFAVFGARLQKQLDNLAKLPLMGKFNGTVGNFSALTIAFPEVDWTTVGHQFVNNLSLKWNLHTTQIEPHDYIAEFSNTLALINTILLGLCRDLWGYIGLNYLVQKTNTTEIGSSVMPHKVNPIDFENAEGNLGLAIAIAQHFATKLPISRWQRDLSDSTVLRNLGVVCAHSLLAYTSIMQGLGKISANNGLLAAELDAHWELLAEPIQTVMRSYGIANSYELLKELTRGKNVTQQTITDFINKLPLPDTAKEKLLQLAPRTYLGLAAELAITW